MFFLSQIESLTFNNCVRYRIASINLLIPFYCANESNIYANGTVQQFSAKKIKDHNINEDLIECVPKQTIALN